MSIIERLEYKRVEGIRVGRFKSQINTSSIVYRVGRNLIDSGPPNQWRFVKAFIEARGINRAFITHHHEDHSGNGGAMREELNMDVLAPPSSLQLLAEGYPLELYRRVIWGNPRTYRAKPLPETVELENNLSLRQLPAPGHSPDMTCFLIPERGWLFTGDLYVAPNPHSARKEDDYVQEIESLRRILAHSFDTVFCAHRGIVKNGWRALRKKLDYLVSLRQEIRHLAQQGYSAAEIRKILLGKEGAISWLTFFHFSKKNLVLSLLGKI